MNFPWSNFDFYVNVFCKTNAELVFYFLCLLAIYVNSNVNYLQVINWTELKWVFLVLKIHISFSCKILSQILDRQTNTHMPKQRVDRIYRWRICPSFNNGRHSFLDNHNCGLTCTSVQNTMSSIEKTKKNIISGIIF